MDRAKTQQHLWLEKRIPALRSELNQSLSAGNRDRATEQREILNALSEWLGRENEKHELSRTLDDEIEKRKSY